MAAVWSGSILYWPGLAAGTPSKIASPPASTAACTRSSVLKVLCVRAVLIGRSLDSLGVLMRKVRTACAVAPADWLCQACQLSAIEAFLKFLRFLQSAVEAFLKFLRFLLVAVVADAQRLAAGPTMPQQAGLARVVAADRVAARAAVVPPREEGEREPARVTLVRLLEVRMVISSRLESRDRGCRRRRLAHVRLWLERHLRWRLKCGL